MSITLIDQMQRLGEQLRQNGDRLEPQVTAFPSGCAMLDVRREGRAFVMSYSPAHGFGVDELHADDGFVNQYRFRYADFEPAARKFRELADSSSSCKEPELSLVVLQARDIEAAKKFYSLLGLHFVPEQHGSGPSHYAAKLGTVVLEIYPCRADTQFAPLRFGFRVPVLEGTIELLRRQGVRIVREARDSPWGKRAVVEDPDGNRVELMTLAPNSPAEGMAAR